MVLPEIFKSILILLDKISGVKKVVPGAWPEEKVDTGSHMREQWAVWQGVSWE